MAAGKHWEQHWRLGLRWLHCGWRLVKRFPLTLLGLGLPAGALIAFIGPLPVVGMPLLMLLAPLWLAAAVVTLDTLAAGGDAPPAGEKPPGTAARVAGRLSQSNTMLTLLALGLVAMTAAVVINIAGHLLSGGQWQLGWSQLDLGGKALALLAGLAALVLYAGLYLGLGFGLVLIALQPGPARPALARGMEIAWRHPLELLLPLAVLLAPAALAAPVKSFSLPAGLGLAWGGATLSFPVFAAALYCCYRTLTLRRSD